MKAHIQSPHGPGFKLLIWVDTVSYRALGCRRKVSGKRTADGMSVVCAGLSREAIVNGSGTIVVLMEASMN